MDREELFEFVDQLVKQKPLNAASQEEENQQREQLMDDLDRSIRLSIVHKMNDEQLDRFNDLLDRDDDAVEDEFTKFFADAGIDLPQTITNVATNFAQAYLGGANA